MKKTPQDIGLASSNSEAQLSNQERELLKNFRAMKATAKQMMIDLSDQYKRTMPAAPVQLRIVSA